MAIKQGRYKHLKSAGRLMVYLQQEVSTAKTRYRQADAPCQLKQVAEDSFTLEFEEAQWAVTPGQSAVLYDGERCLGGGIITS